MALIHIDKKGHLCILHATVHTKCDTTCKENEVLFSKTFLIRPSYKPLSSSLLSFTYHLTFSQTVKWDPNTFLCWILQNYLWAAHLIILCWNGNPSFIGKKNVGFTAGTLLLPHRNVKLTWSARRGDLAHESTKCEELSLQLQWEGNCALCRIMAQWQRIVNILTKQCHKWTEEGKQEKENLEMCRGRKEKKDEHLKLLTMHPTIFFKKIITKINYKTPVKKLYKKFEANWSKGL